MRFLSVYNTEGEVTVDHCHDEHHQTGGNKRIQHDAKACKANLEVEVIAPFSDENQAMDRVSRFDVIPENEDHS